MSYLKIYKTLILRLVMSLLGMTGAGLSVQAASLHFSMNSATVHEKDTFAIVVNADSVLTGKGVYSYRFYITYNASRYEFLGVDSVATMLDSWGLPIVNGNTPGVVICAGAGAQALTGSGEMLYLSFRSLNSYRDYFRFTSAQCYVNEGSPTVAFSDYYLNLIARSYPNIYYDSGTLYVGEEAQMYVSGGEGPFTFNTSNPSVAVITDGTKIKAQSPGLTKVYVTDANGEVNYTTGNYEVRAVKMSLQSVTSWPTDTFQIPVKIEIAPGTMLHSGSFELTFNSNLTVISESAIIGDYPMAIQSKASAGIVRVSFATVFPISGNGVLCYISCIGKASGNHYLYFQNVLFDEALYAFTSNNYMQINTLPTLSFSPNTGNLMWGETQKVTVSNGTAPYQFSVNDTSVATIDQLGNLYAKSGGKVTVKAVDDHGANKSSGVFTVNDNIYSILNTEGELDKDTRVPISTSLLPSGKKVFSYDGVINYQDVYLDFVRIDAVDPSMLVTAVENGNTVHIVGAASNGISSGIIGYLVFRIKPALALDATANVNFTSFTSNENGLFSTLVNGKVKRVEQVSYRPIAHAGYNFSVQEGNVAQLDGSLSYDEDNDPLTYSWTSPVGIVLNDSTLQLPQFTAPEVNANKQLVFTLVVNDGNADSDPVQVTVTVLQVNKKPIAHAGDDETVIEGSNVSLNGSTSIDPDGDAISYQWTSLDGIVLFNPTSNRPSFIAPQINTDTKYRFKLVVKDALLSSDPDTVTITVSQVNKKPVAFAGGDQTVEEGDPVQLDGSLSADADNDPITYLWTAPSVVSLSSNTDAKPTFTAPAVHRDSTLIFSLVVNDGKENSSADNVLVRVINVDTLSIKTKIDSVMLMNMDSFMVDTLKSEVLLYMPYGYNVSAMAPNFKLSPKAMVTPLGGTSRNFTTPQSYVVTAEDGKTKQTWKVSVYVPNSTQKRLLESGWNWISLNVSPTDLSVANVFGALTHSETDYLKSKEYSSVFYNGSGWFGDFSFMPQLQMVQYKKTTSELWSVTGNEINPSMVSIPLATGWNNIGYLLKTNADINKAIQTATIPTGDVLLKSKNESAIYYSGSGWAGALDSLRVLEGYKIKVQHTGNLKYDVAGVTTKAAYATVFSAHELYRKYGLDASNFERSATLIAEVVDDNGNNLLLPGDLVVAYHQNEVRGVGECRYVSALDRHIFILTYFANAKDEEIVFSVVSHSESVSYPTDFTVAFEQDAVLGEPYRPTQLKVATFNAVSDIASKPVISLYPNPVYNQLHVSSYHVVKQVGIYNASGVLVNVGNYNANEVSLSVESLPDGLYTVRIETSAGLVNKKIVKALK